MMNSQAHATTSHRAAADAHAMAAFAPEDPVDVIREATSHHSHVFSWAHSAGVDSLDPEHLRDLHASQREGLTSAMAEAKAEERGWPFVAVLLVTLVALGAGDWLLLKHLAHPSVDATPFAQVVDLED